MIERLLSGFFRLLAGLLSLAAFGLFAAGLFVSISFRQLEENDYPDIVRLNPVVMAATFALCMLAAIFFIKKGLADKRLFVASLALSAALCVMFVLVIRGLPTNDAKQLDEIVSRFGEGDYSALDPGGYLGSYPFQLSWCAVIEVFSRLFGEGVYAPYRWANVISIVLNLLFLSGIAVELTGEKRAAAVMMIPGALCLWLFAYSTFIYNDIICLAPLFGGIYLIIRSIKSGSPVSGVAGAALLSVSWWLKSNGLIALIAAFMAVFAALLKDIVRSDRRRIASFVIVLILLAALPLSLRYATNRHYSEISGMEIPEGVPATAYFAMGLAESDGKYGWYNGENVRFLHDNGDDAKAASKAASVVARERLGTYLSNPKSFAKFFGMKFFSQWGDPTRVSLREQELTGRHQENMGRAFQSFISGAGFETLSYEMRIWQLFVMFAAGAELAATALGKRRIEPQTGLLLLFIFGGMAFHEIWEASGRYTMRYCLALLPFAAAGLIRLSGLGAGLKGRSGGRSFIDKRGKTR